MTGSRLPDFVIVGAARSGSSSLNRYLADHPDVFMAEEKEVRFFDRHFDRGVEWYTTRFEGARPDQVVGEATPSYMYHDLAIARLAKTIPSVKAVAILRSPVDRAYSHYQMNVARAREERSWEEVVTEELRSPVAGGYVDRSRYALQLERVIEHLGRSNCCFVSFERLRDDPSATYAVVCAFIGVEPVSTKSLGQEVNAYFTIRSQRVRRLSRKHWMPKRAGNLIARLNHRRVRYPAMDPALRRVLNEHLADDWRRTAELAGWTEVPAL